MDSSHHAQLRSRWYAAVLALGGSALLAACGSTGPGGAAAGAASPSAAATPSAAVPCTTIASLRQSLANLDQLQVNQRTVGQVAADLGSIDTQLTTLKSQAQTAYSGESAQLTAAVRQVSGAARALAARPSAANLTAVQSAVSGLKASSEAVIVELKAACPAS
jgi:hypothetical protein